MIKNIIFNSYLINIIYEDNNLLIINKPSGLQMYDFINKNNKYTILKFLMYYYRNNNTKINIPNNKKYRLGITHRLDKNVSGILICVKTIKYYINIIHQFKMRNIKKEYIILVLNKNIKEKYGMIRTYIARHKYNRLIMDAKITQENKKNCKFGITYWFKIKDFKNNTSLIKCFSYTGRTHQIRIHFKYIKCPIIGDDKYYYNKISNNVNYLLKTTISRIMLHAYKITFFDIYKKKYLSFCSSIPCDFIKFIKY